MKVSKWTKVLDVVVVVLMNISIIVMGLWLSIIPIAKDKDYYVERYKENLTAKHIIETTYPGVDVDEAIDIIAEVNVEYFFGNKEEYKV